MGNTLSDDAVADLRAMKRMLANVKFAGMAGKVTRDGITIGPPAFPPSRGANGRDDEKWVIITGNAAGGGKYNGAILLPPTANIAATGNVAVADFGTSGAGILVLNRQEAGHNTHLLSSGDIYLARYLQTNNQGTPVYGIDPRLDGLRLVDLTQVGGSAGTNNPLATASYAYDMADSLSGDSVGSGQSFAFQRPSAGHVAAAGTGLAYRAADGTYTLLFGDEVYDTENCT